ncbi:MAG TPA: DNA repair protein RadA [Caldisericia bacterium]|nr:DNA repair protein RadA [Caldisericia bacterium]HXK51698.1 DNA repair protein RadA [Caldisericia bacterium]
MKKKTILYQCSQCGYTSPGMLGKCPECGEWNSFEPVQNDPLHSTTRIAPQAKPVALFELADQEGHRCPTKLEEVDRVLGGGVVEGSVILIGGEPGIGKSTLLLQIADALSHHGKVLYASGEESPSQIKLRASRLGIHQDTIFVSFETEISSLQNLVEEYSPRILIVDSIQTTYTQDIDGTTGSISQIRESTQRLVQLAKKDNVTVFIVGHVTKDGNIAGPKFLEHLVDVVLYLEGDKNGMIRMLRGNKNRFGETGELGIFTMKDKGLFPVQDPSEVFLGKHQNSQSGTIIFPSLEGIRTIFLEIQALCTQTYTPIPRRVVNGTDINRTLMLAAILEKRIGQSFIGMDYFVNITGGTRIVDPASDLPISMALLSSLMNIPISAKLISFGELGLSGEIRPVMGTEKRIKESLRRHFHPIIIPAGSIEQNDAPDQIIEVSHIQEIPSIIKQKT